jgi:hypothetical protein
VAERTDAPTTPAPEKASLFEDFIDIFVSPSKVFARRANASFWPITLVLTVIGAVFAFAMAGTFETAMDAEFTRNAAKMMEENPQLTEEQLTMMRRGGTMFAKYALYIATPFLVIIWGFFVWIVGKVFGAAMSYSQAAMIVAYAQIPRLLSSVAFIVQGMMLDPATTGLTGLSLSPARFMDPATTSSGLVQLLARMDIFVIWTTLLVGLGVAIVGGIPKARGYMVALTLWLLGSLTAIWGALRG